MANVYSKLLDSFNKSIVLDLTVKSTMSAIKGLLETLQKATVKSCLTESFNSYEELKSIKEEFGADLKEAFEYLRKFSEDQNYDTKLLENYYGVIEKPQFRENMISLAVSTLFCINPENKGSVRFVLNEDTEAYSYSYIKNRENPVTDVKQIDYYQFPAFYNQIDNNIKKIIKARLGNNKKDLENFNFYITHLFREELKIRIKPYKDENGKDCVSLIIINLSANNDVKTVNGFNNMYDKENFEYIVSTYDNDPLLKRNVHNYLINNGFKQGLEYDSKGN